MELEDHSLRQRLAQIMKATRNWFSGAKERTNQRLEMNAQNASDNDGMKVKEFMKKQKNDFAKNAARKLSQHTRRTHKRAITY